MAHLLTRDHLARPRSKRQLVLRLLAVVAIVVVILSLTLPRHSPLRRAWSRFIGGPSSATLIDDLDDRDALLTERDRHVARHRLIEAARINGNLAQESLLRARQVHIDWLARRHPTTHLYPQKKHRQEWNYRNTAADFFAFQIHAVIWLNPAAMPSIRETLAAEAALTTPEGLCRPAAYDTAKPTPVDHDELMFGSSEYVKDGLISVFDRYGGDLIGPRLYAIVDAIIANSREMSRFGPVPGRGSEINGNMLQVCSRLSFAGQRPDYADFAARIADAYLSQAMPLNNGLAPETFDFANDRVIDPVVKLKDHGNEVIPGLAEAYAMAVALRQNEVEWQERADRWAGPLALMLETILAQGRNVDGLIVRNMTADPPRAAESRHTDNWGYVLNGAYLFADAARRHGRLPRERLNTITARADDVARAVARTHGLDWSDMDGSADSIESALYVASHRPGLRDGLLRWADREVHFLNERFAREERPEGFYLDGNFIRTSLMYAESRAGGWRADPWRQDVIVGWATEDDQEDVEKAALVVRASKPYKGTLRPDGPRSQTIMRLPFEWPRLNTWPEWFVVDDAVRLTSSDGITPAPTIQSLHQGVPLDLPAGGQVVLTFSRRPVSIRTTENED